MNDFNKKTTAPPQSKLKYLNPKKDETNNKERSHRKKFISFKKKDV